ncbi:MAG: translation elongation factor Ts [Prevotellaceae bacterium]|jgi:elongation factor Ts|nr:translation elongation factor Ts [Prevotellaceae bacterium]
MAVTMADVTKLRKMTGAGMMDCKNALTEANGDFDQAIKIIREKGQAVAAKRSDRDASEGCVLVKAVDGFGAIIALKCETDFVAKNADFIKLASDILDAAIANKCKTLDEVKTLPLGDVTVAQAVIDRSGITGEKMELDGYMTLEGASIATYNHQHKNFLCTMVLLNKVVEGSVGHDIAMQVAAMSPIAVDEKGVPEAVLAQEKEIAAEKARQEGKPENMIEKIALGRLSKFYKEACLLKQEYVQDAKLTVADYLKTFDKELTVVDFKRFTLRAE